MSEYNEIKEPYHSWKWWEDYTLELGYKLNKERQKNFWLSLTLGSIAILTIGLIAGLLLTSEVRVNDVCLSCWSKQETKLNP